LQFTNTLENASEKQVRGRKV